MGFWGRVGPVWATNFDLVTFGLLNWVPQHVSPFLWLLACALGHFTRAWKVGTDFMSRSDWPGAFIHFLTLMGYLRWQSHLKQFTLLVRNKILLQVFAGASFTSPPRLVTCTLVKFWGVDIIFLSCSVFMMNIFSSAPFFLLGKKRSLQNPNQFPYLKNWIGFDYHDIN